MNYPGLALWVVAGLIGLCVPIALAWMGVFVAMGAHPWWALNVAFIGAPIGGALALVPLRAAPKVIFGILILGASFGIAGYGKTRFSASYAEDTLAGQLWYFGWIGVAVGGALLVAALVGLFFSRRVQPS